MCKSLVGFGAQASTSHFKSVRNKAEVMTFCWELNAVFHLLNVNRAKDGLVAEFLIF